MLNNNYLLFLTYFENIVAHLSVVRRNAYLQTKINFAGHLGPGHMNPFSDN